MKFGMPYKGSKNSIAQHIIDVMPPAEHFYDLFGGGGAVTHCAALSGKFKYVHYNEFNPVVCEGFMKAVKGMYKTEDRWISREDFMNLKGSDPYVAICFSFGNDLKTYAYGRDIEEYKKGFHYFLFFNDRTILEKFVDLKGFEFRKSEMSEKYNELKNFLKTTDFKNKCILESGERLFRLQNFDKHQGIEQLSCLQSFERLERLERLEYSCLSYEKVPIEEDSVIYCDPPYSGTNKYTVEFDHEKFYSWARLQKNIYVSEYSMPDDFHMVGFVNKRSLMDAAGKAGTKKEKLFTNRHEDSFILC